MKMLFKYWNFYIETTDSPLFLNTKSGFRFGDLLCESFVLWNEKKI